MYFEFADANVRLLLWNLLTLLSNACCSTTNPSLWHVREINVSAKDNGQGMTLPTVVLCSTVPIFVLRTHLMGIVMSYGSWWRVRRRRPLAAIWYVWSCSLVVIMEDLTNCWSFAPYMNDKSYRCLEVRWNALQHEYQAHERRSLMEIWRWEGPYGSIWAIESLELAPYS